MPLSANSVYAKARSFSLMVFSLTSTGTTCITLLLSFVTNEDKIVSFDFNSAKITSSALISSAVLVPGLISVNFLISTASWLNFSGESSVKASLRVASALAFLAAINSSGSTVAASLSLGLNCSAIAITSPNDLLGSTSQ